MREEAFINNEIYYDLIGDIKKFEFTPEDLMKVKVLSVGAFDLSGQFVSNDLGDLNYFKNLEKISLSGFIVNRPNIKLISDLKKLRNFEFRNCEFKDCLNIKGDAIDLDECKNIGRVSVEQFKNVTIKNCEVDGLSLDSAKNLTLEKMKMNEKLEQLIRQLQTCCNIKLITCKYESKEQKEGLRQLENVRIIKDKILTNSGVIYEDDEEAD